MLTTNLDLSDKLCNGQIGTIKHFKQNQAGEVSTIYLQMEDENVGLKTMRTDPLAQ